MFNIIEFIWVWNAWPILTLVDW